MNIPKVTIEIGYNHLGSKFLLDSLINNLLDSNFDLTFQYRTTKINDFNPECDLQLGIYYLIEIKNKIKSYSHFQNKIGIAIDSFDDFELIVENFDFIKILSFTENKKEFFNKVNCQKPIYLSCGLEKLNNIEEYHNIARKRNILLNFIYTSFDFSGYDISQQEINFIYKLNNLISFGLHQFNKEIIYVISSLFDLDRVFLYLNPGFKPDNLKLLPDSSHSLNIEEINELSKMLDLINNFKLKAQEMTSKI